MGMMKIATKSQGMKDLEDMFRMNVRGVIALAPFAPRTAFVFDFDGVLLHECGMVETGYAWLARAVREGNWDIHDHDVTERDVSEVRALRPVIKGKPPVEKVTIFWSRFGSGSRLPFSPETAVERWFSFVKDRIQCRFGRNPSLYLIPGAADMVKAAKEYGPVFGLTANIQSQADFLMEFVGLSPCFDRIVGYAPSAGPGTDKGAMLADLLALHGVDPQETAFIGDGTSDMRAAHRAGALAVGIANDLQNGRGLIEADCGVIATDSRVGRTLVEFLA